MRGPSSPRFTSASRRRVLATALGALTLAACGRAGNTGLLSEAPLKIVPAPSPAAEAFPPVRFPQDEAPHDALSEWWYYTGHLYAPGAGPDATEEEYGFELVFFRGVRGDRPPGYAAHFAITDLARGRFRFDQRSDVALDETAGAQARPGSGLPATAKGEGPILRSAQHDSGQGEPRGALPPGMVSAPQAGGGFDLSLGGWRMRGKDGRDHLAAAMPGYTLEADLSATRPPALHVGVPPLQPGLLSFGPAGYSYYYSRTRMALTGTLQVEGGPPRPLRGQAWMDHQWGNFLVLGGGGWDWFAGNLDDGRDVTISVLRDASGAPIVAYGTLVEANGEARHLPPGSFMVSPAGTWTSPRTNVRYPSGWRLQAPEADLDLVWTPLLADQELDTRTSTGVSYWEGAVALQDPASRAERGRGYVELTGYRPGQ